MPTLVELPPALLVGVAVSLGLAFGSFLNVVIHRVPRGESVVRPGSRCPGCGTPIHGRNNIPVLSWIVLRGKAPCCGAPIHWRYPLVELLGGLTGWAIVETVIAGLPDDTIWWRALIIFCLHLALGLGLIAAAFIDLEHMLLPDSITLGGAVLGVASVPLRPDVDWIGSLGGAAIGFLMVWVPFDLIYTRLRGQPGMGLGDAKLMMLAGAWFGWQGALFALLAGAVQGTVFAIAVFLVRGNIDEPEAVKREREELRRAVEEAEGEERRLLEEELARDPIATEAEAGFGRARIAFGPFLVLATLEYMLFGKVLTDGYLALLWDV